MQGDDAQRTAGVECLQWRHRQVLISHGIAENGRDCVHRRSIGAGAMHLSSSLSFLLPCRAFKRPVDHRLNHLSAALMPDACRPWGAVAVAVAVAITQ